MTVRWWWREPKPLGPALSDRELNRIAAAEHHALLEDRAARQGPVSLRLRGRGHGSLTATADAAVGAAASAVGGHGDLRCHVRAPGRKHSGSVYYRSASGRQGATWVASLQHTIGGRRRSWTRCRRTREAAEAALAALIAEHGTQVPTACIHGHPFDDANTVVDGNGHRHCRACRRDVDRRRRRR